MKLDERPLLLAVPAVDSVCLASFFPSHHDELLTDWQLAVGGEEPVKIAPLN